MEIVLEGPDREVDVSLARLGRRAFVRMASAGAVSTAMVGCDRPPPEDALPYVRRPEEVVPGVSRYYATSWSRAGYAVGLLGETREGRPIKIEGHPDHPASLGATSAVEQAAIWSLYDSGRLTALHPTARGLGSFRAVATHLGKESSRAYAKSDGRGLGVWLRPFSSPVTASLVLALLEQWKDVRVVCDRYAGVPHVTWDSTMAAFGRVLEPRHHLSRARVIAAFDADFLDGAPDSIALARGLAETRAPLEPSGTMSRFYMVEPGLTITGGMADHRLPVRPTEVERVLGLLYDEVHRVAGNELAGHELAAFESSDVERVRAFVHALARDLLAHRGESVVIVGTSQTPAAHVLGHALNERLGATGRTVTYGPSVIYGAGGPIFDVDSMLAAMRAGEIETLVTLGANPAYALPTTLAYDRAVAQVKEHLHLTLYANETSARAHLVLPEAHPFEAWGLGRAFDGTLTVAQPLVSPLFGVRTVDEVLSFFSGGPREGRQLVERTAGELALGVSFAELVGGGFAPGSDHGAVAVTVRADAVQRARREIAGRLSGPNRQSEPHRRSEGTRTVEVAIRREAGVRDERLLDNAWLDELPHPITKQVWGNAAWVGEALARELGLETGHEVELIADSGRVRLPAWVLPGLAPQTVVVSDGYGRRGDRQGDPQGERDGERAVGISVNVLRTEPAIGRSVRLRKTGRPVEIITTQAHDRTEDREIVLHRSLADWREHPDFAKRYAERPPSILPERSELVPGYFEGTETAAAAPVQWGMAIDLNRCTGCSSCVIACQAENNVPVVGPNEVAMGREMHWLRIDRYYLGDGDHPEPVFQPMLCQHCAQAPCEYVCPVSATVHSPDGLNEMIYNRCVGTRFCSSNCPYKVRRFNYLEYNGDLAELERMQKNPDVTVRARGVMEKCTFCVQRIRRAEIEARNERRALAPDEVETACAGACPTRAITFGIASAPGSSVSEISRSPRSYAVLYALGTEPRVRYLSRITNPHPELAR